MQLHVDVDMRIDKPPQDVFEAIVDPQLMSNYFISSGSGPMRAGEKVHWRWDDVGAEGDIDVTRTEPARAVAFTWDAAGGGKQEVNIELTADGAATEVRITEGTFESDEDGIHALAGQTYGWALFLCHLTAYLEYGIELRRGAITRTKKEMIAAQ